MKRVIAAAALAMVALTGCTSAGFTADPVDGRATVDDSLVQGDQSECFYVEAYTSEWSTNTRGLGVFCKEDLND